MKKIIKETLSKSFMLLWGISLLLLVVAGSLWLPQNTQSNEKETVTLPELQTPQNPPKTESTSEVKKSTTKKKVEYRESQLNNPTPTNHQLPTNVTSPQQPNVRPVVKPVSQAVVIISGLGNFPVEIKAGDTAFDILIRAAKENNFVVKYQMYSFGVFVTQIGQRAGDSSHYWAFYYNGQYSNVGASAQPIREGDVTGWNYETF